MRDVKDKITIAWRPRPASLVETGTLGTGKAESMLPQINIMEIYATNSFKKVINQYYKYVYNIYLYTPLLKSSFQFSRPGNLR